MSLARNPDVGPVLLVGVIVSLNATQAWSNSGVEGHGTLWTVACKRRPNPSGLWA